MVEMASCGIAHLEHFTKQQSKDDIEPWAHLTSKGCAMESEMAQTGDTCAFQLSDVQVCTLSIQEVPSCTETKDFGFVQGSN